MTTTEIEPKTDPTENPVEDRSGDLGTQGDPTADDRATGAGGRIRQTVAAYKVIGRTPYGYKPALILGFIGFVALVDGFTFQVAGPEIARDLEINVGTIISVLVIIDTIGIFAAIAVGYYADRHRRVPMVGIGAIVAGIFSIISSRGMSSFFVTTSRGLSTGGTYTALVPQFSLLGDYYPPEVRGRVFAVVTSIQRSGRVIAIVLVGALVTGIGWRTTTVLFGIPLIVTGIVALLFLREPVRGYMERKAQGADEVESLREDEPLSLGESWRATIGTRTIRRFMISNVIAECGDYTVALFYPFFLAERYGANAFERGLIALPAVAAALIGGIIGGNLIDRFVRRDPGRVLLVVGAFGIVAAAGVALYALRPPLLVLIAANAIVSFGGALLGPARNVVYINVIPPAIRTTGLQITGLVELPAKVVFTGLAGLFFTEYGYESLFLLTIPFLVIGSLVAMTAGSFYDLDIRAAAASALASTEWRKMKAGGTSKMLVCRDVDVAYNGVQVLFGVDFDVEEGEIVALLGTNGAGKSTLLRAISGTQPATSGGIVFDGRDITRMPPHEVAARRVIHMPGGRGVFPGLTVRDNLLLGSWLDDDPTSVQARLTEVFEIFPVLAERADQQATLLSGGEQQQLSLAQAFLANPKLLLIDELSLGLSPAVVGQLVEIVKEIHRSGVTIVVVEQSINVALTLADKAVFMEKGEVKFVGRTAELLARPDILRAVYVKGTGALTDGAPSGAARSEREMRSLELGARAPVLEIDGIVKRYGGVTAIGGVSFDLREGEVLGIIGPNGAGKTTLFDIISGFQSADEGVIRYEGVDITRLSPEERARRKLVRRFQDARLFPSLTVFETLLVSLEQRLEVRSVLLGGVGAPAARKDEKRARVRAERLLELLELSAYRDKFVRELSTGLRRIVDLACVLAAEPKVLLLDEPSSGIAQAEAEGLAPLLRRVRFETGCSILIIEHDMPLISAVSDELVALEQGTFVTRGTPEEVLNDERVIEAYLGTSEAAVKRSGSLT